MALNTVTLLSLIQSLAESNNDFLSFSTTTVIAGSSTVVLSTTLNQYDNGEDDAFNDWWFYLNSTNNPTVMRKVSDYATTGGSLTLYGANLIAESVAQTCYLFRYNRDHYKRAVIEASKEIYPSIHKKIDDMTLITGNILPDGSFESWSSATALNWYSVGSATLARTSTEALYRGQKGTYSVGVTAGATNDYIELDSDTYPKLLDLMGRTVDFYTWAYPSTANDPSIQIYTLKADSTAQTLPSTTTAPATKWTKLKLENQSLNDDLVYVRLRWIVATSGANCYFDDAYLSGMMLSEYLLPDNFYTGHVTKVTMQTQGYSDETFYDIHPFQSYRGKEYPPYVTSDGIYLWLKFDETPISKRRIRLEGFAPLEALSADEDKITLNTATVPLLTALARMIFFKREATPISQEDKSRFEQEGAKAFQDYYRLLISKRMPREAEMIRYG